MGHNIPSCLKWKEDTTVRNLVPHATLQAKCKLVYNITIRPHIIKRQKSEVQNSVSSRAYANNIYSDTLLWMNHSTRTRHSNGRRLLPCQYDTSTTNKLGSGKQKLKYFSSWSGKFQLMVPSTVASS